MNVMSRNTVLLGLKTDFDSGDDLSDFFSSMSDDDNSELILTTKVTPSSFTVPKELEQDLGRVTSFNEILSNISSISNMLEDFETPPNPNNICLIPENIVPTELSKALTTFVEDQNNQAAYNTIIHYLTNPDLPDILLAQIDLIKFYKEKKNANLTKYISKDLDSRVLSLIHYALIDDNDKQCAIYQLVCSIEDFLKNPNPLPISNFFPNYTLQNLVYSLCKDIVIEFPRHPFLQSAITKFSNFNPKVEEVLNLIPEDDSDDDEDDFSDDFFADLGTVQQRAPILTLEIANEEIGDVLEDVTAAPRYEPVALPEPPQTVTYLFEDGSNQMSPIQFEKWILSIRCEIPTSPKFIHSANTSITSEIIYTKKPILQKRIIENENKKKQKKSKLKWENIGTYFNLYQSLTESRLSIQQLPRNVPKEYYSLLLPILHVINSLKNNEIPCELFPDMLKIEREAHYSLSINDENHTQEILETIIDKIEKSKIIETSIDDIEVEYLQKKRNHPELIVDLNETFEELMYICDYEFIINGRSPLIYSVLSIPITKTKNSKICNEKWRSKILFSEYLKNNYSPYITFRIAFALAVNFSERNPKLSCSFIFEALYILLYGFPVFKRIIFIHSALLFFGEMLDKTNKYYYCADVMDNYFLTDIRQLSFSSQIAQISFRNNDIIRSLFYYTQSLKYFYAKNSMEESIYFGQIVSSIYIEQGYYSEAASVLMYLLHKSYDVQVNKRRRLTLAATVGGSLKTPKILNHFQTQNKSGNFSPDQNSVTTIVSSVTLAIIFCKLNLFVQSEKLLLNTYENTDKLQMKRLISYFRAWECLKRNNFQEMFNYIPQYQFPKTRVSLTTNFSILTANKFDPSVASLRLLAIAYLERYQYKKSIFYSEVYIQRCYFSSLKELGNAFLLRGISLFLTLKNCYGEIEIIENDNKTLGNIIENKKYTIGEIINMTYSSFATAKICFQRVESINKLIRTNLFMLDLLLEYPELHAEPYQPLIEVPNKNISEWPINLEIQKEDINRLNTNIESMSSLIFNPLYIIYSQLLSSIVNTQKNKNEQSKKLFEYSYNNFFKFFVCGCHLISNDFPLKTLNLMFYILQRMSLILFTYEIEFINEHLLIFDIMNDIRIIIKNKLQNIKIDSINLIKPSINFSKHILNLQSLRFPSFINILEDYNFIDEYLETRSLKIPEYLSLINTNVRLYKQGKITQEEMNNRNRSICGNIEKQTEKERYQRKSYIPSCTSFKYLIQAHPILNGLIFIQRIFQNIYIYIPSKGKIRKIPLINTKDPIKQVNYICQKNSISFNTQSNLFTPNLIRYIIKLISFDLKEKIKLKTKYINEINNISQTFFEDDFKDFIYDVYPDDLSFNNSHIFNKNNKGALYTLNTGSHPVIINTSADLQMIPFDFLLPNSLTISCPYFSYLILKTSVCNTNVPRVVSCQCMDNPTQRIIENVYNLFCDVCNSNMNPILTVDKCKKSLCYPFPLSLNNEQNDYAKKYTFCDFVDVLPNSFPKILNMSSSIFVFTYADFCEMPFLIHKLISEYPSSYFLFIPAVVMKEAFQEMKEIFERHNQRFAFVKDKEEEEKYKLHIELKENNFQFVTTLKLTLQKNLKVPIPLIAHLL